MREKILAFAVCIMCSLTILSSEAKWGEDSLFTYWKRPIPLQISNSLHPESCGECHKEQYDGWKSSLHSKAVGPGLLGQLNPHEAPGFAESCYFCHAPMEEQAEAVIQGAGGKGQGIKGSGVRGQGSEDNEYIKNPSFDNKLKLSGVSCSVCHLRGGKIYGPPKREKGSGVRGLGSGEKSQISNLKSQIKDAHDGFVEKDFFEKAEFCAVCHQLDEGYELNGKLLVNTYREWKESIYGKNNIICQNCHMPDRQHLWRGIHDKETVLQGLRIESVQHDKGARLTITNSGIGHYFPAYATPLVVVKGFMLDKNGKVIHDSLKEAFIGRKVSLDLSEEIFDTRIPPQKSFEFDYDYDTYNNEKTVFEIWAYPDEFYNRFYSALLKSENRDINRKAIKKALKATKDSGYRLFRKIL